MEIELEDGFWWSFSRLALDSHSSYHRDGSKTKEGKVKRRPCRSKQGICASPSPGYIWSFLWGCSVARLVLDSWWHWTWEALLLPTHLCLLESASVLLDPYPGLFVEYSLKSWRQSGIDYLANVVSLLHEVGRREGIFCLPAAQPSCSFRQARAFRFPVCFRK